MKPFIKPFIKQPIFFTALALTAGLNACVSAPPNSGPSPLPSTSSLPTPYQSGNPPVSPIPTPTATSTGSLPIPDATPTPGTEDISTKSEADVVARRESRNLQRVWPGPDGKIVFSYSRQFEADLKGWSYNPAVKQIEGGFWLAEADGRQRELPQLNGLSSWAQVFWLDSHRLAWLPDEGQSIETYDLESGIRASLFKADRVSSLSQLGDQLYFLARQNNEDKLVSLNPATGSSRTAPVPYQSFYASSVMLTPLGGDKVLLSQSKANDKKGNYPFKVMSTATPPPPFMDSYVVGLGDGKATPVNGALDLNQYDSIRVSPDQQAFLVQQSAQSVVYDFEGKQLLTVTGRGIWLDKDQVLNLEPKGLAIHRLSDGQELYRASTQTTCNDGQANAAGQVLIHCELSTSSKPMSRVYRISGADGRGPLQELPLNLPAEGRAVLDTASGLVLSTVPGPSGYTAAYAITAQGQPQERFRVSNPAEASFSFDPKDGTWTRGGY